jgi:glycosyltransferase involved in cell wall biosynthesis
MTPTHQPSGQAAPATAGGPPEPSERRPRVAVIGTRGYPSHYGGFESAVRRLAPALADAGWDVTVYGRPGATSADGADPRIVRRETRGLETRSLSTLTFGLTATLDTARRRPDVVLVMNCANGFWLPLLSARGIPTLVNVDGIEWERAKWGRAARAVFRAGAVATARWADRVVCDAREIARRWHDDFGVDGVFVPYGADEPEPETAELATADSHLEPGAYVLFVARFVPENTVAEFMEAAETVARRHTVVIVGSSGYGGDLDDRVAHLAARSPRVVHLGHLRDDRRLFALWRNAGVYFHGHSVGGTNPALVQAMVCGAPVVARDTVYNREVLGAAGVFVAPEPDEIARAVTDLLDDSARRADLGEAARRRARRYYAWSDVCAAYETQLRDLLR